MFYIFVIKRIDRSINQSVSLRVSDLIKMKYQNKSHDREVLLKASACSSVDSLQLRQFSGTLGLPYTLMLLVCHAVSGWPPSLSAYQHGRATEREGERERLWGWVVFSGHSLSIPSVLWGMQRANKPSSLPGTPNP